METMFAGDKLYETSISIKNIVIHRIILLFADMEKLLDKFYLQATTKGICNNSLFCMVVTAIGKDSNSHKKIARRHKIIVV